MVIAYRVIVTMARRNRSAIMDGTSIMDPLGSSEEEAIRRETASRVRDALAKLRPLDRDALTAYYFDGLSLQEVADRFGVPLGTAKRRLCMARRRIGVLLD